MPTIAVDLWTHDADVLLGFIEKALPIAESDGMAGEREALQRLYCSIVRKLEMRKVARLGRIGMMKGRRP